MLQYGDPPTDWRNEVFIKAYNEVAVDVAQRLNVPVIDVFNVASALSDLSWDGAHYLLPVEREIARVVLHILSI